ncbi:hypothetical protein Bca4012_098326 [Brassica carinata]|uniref:RRM domain-containing protein n=1 Tax=Brassica carinata TaxID=52824 RepID=A0A8X7TQV2_BRACI|nr:hypothetical protein Bca52824_081013 [Brassica carinata]
MFPLRTAAALTIADSGGDGGCCCGCDDGGDGGGCGGCGGKVILESAILTTVVVLSLTVYTFWAAKGGYDFNFLGHSITMDTTESEVTELFGRFGDIDRITAYSSRGFAFICETSLFLSL